MRVSAHSRYEFSAAHRLDKTGAGAERRLHGHNYVLWVGLTGSVRPETGTILDPATVSEAVWGALDRFDGRYLNGRLGAIEPTTANVASAIWADLRSALPAPARLSSVELQEEGGDAARVADEGLIHIVHGDFSAAHRTHAPQLSLQENAALYGRCNNPAGHGHNYHVEVLLPAGTDVPGGLWEEFDHRNLSADIPDLIGRNVVTEAVADLISRRVPPAHSVRVWETPDFFAEYLAVEGAYRLGRRYRFRAAHRLAAPCRPGPSPAAAGEPHGHSYLVELHVRGRLDPRSGTAYDLGRLDRLAGEVLQGLDYTCLEDDVAEFGDRPSTVENVAACLWSRFARAWPDASGPEALCLWETPRRRAGVKDSRGTTSDD